MCREIVSRIKSLQKEINKQYNQAVHLTPRTCAALSVNLLGGASDLDRYSHLGYRSKYPTESFNIIGH